VTTVASHDTASAVVAVPATDERFAFVSSGTWSLVGLELDQPVLTDAARDANFSNERGVDGRTRFLRNVGGLWLLEECRRAWAEEGHPHTVEALLDEAAVLPSGGPIVDVDDESFLAPGGMPERVVAAVAPGREPPSTPGAITRCILDSLAEAYARTVARAGTIAARTIDKVHVIGGGSRNPLLCQLTADACGLPVWAGPGEATALGNVLVQARSHGAVAADLDSLRATIAAGREVRPFRPRRAIGATS
jgi:rhamnulokinase